MGSLASSARFQRSSATWIQNSRWQFQPPRSELFDVRRIFNYGAPVKTKLNAVVFRLCHYEQIAGPRAEFHETMSLESLRMSFSNIILPDLSTNTASVFSVMNKWEKLSG